MRVYLFDDDPDIHFIVRAWLDEDPDLEFVGGQLTEQEALAEVVEVKPDVVLLDHMMPGSMGVDRTVECLRELIDTKVILFSGYPAKELDAANISSMADGFLTKDAGPDELRARLRAVAG